MKYILSILLSAFLLIPFTASAQKIVFTPQWTAQSQFAGYYVALEKGFYKDAGLDVEIRHPSASNSAINRLIEGSSNIISLQLLQAIGEIDKGVQLVNLLQTSRHNGLVVVSRKDSLTSFKELTGKRVGIWQAGFGELAIMMDKELKVGINWIPFIQNVNLFISGAIDATLAMSYNEYLQIYASGFDKNPVIRLADEGYDIPDDGLYVTREFYDRFPEKMKAFAEASRKGWEWTHNNPEEALDIVMEMAKSCNIPTNRIHQEWMLKEILSLQKDTPDTPPPFSLDKEIFEKASILMFKNGLTTRQVKYEELICND